MSKPRPSDVYFGSSELGDQPSTTASAKDQPRTTTDGVSVEFLTEALAGRTLEQDIVAAATGRGRTLFDGLREKITGVLNDSYPVALGMLQGGEAAVEEVLNHPLFPKRQRIHRKKPFLIALQLSAQPQDEAQFKALSDYAAILQCAALREIPPEDFAERMGQVSLKNAKTFVATLKKAGLLGTAGAPPAKEKQETELRAKVLEEGQERSNQPFEAPTSPPVSEPKAALPSSKLTAPNGPSAAAPKKVAVEKDNRVQSPVIALRVTIFDEAGKHPFRWALTTSQVKALRALDPKRFAGPAGYLQALAKALQTRPHYRIVKKLK